MSWSYVGTPYSGVDKVRALIGDVNEDDPFVTDFEIEALLSVFPNEVEAAAHLCLNLAARFAIEGDIKVDGYTFEHIKKAEFFKDLSRELFLQVHGNSRAIPLANASFGGFSRVAKDSNRANTDNVRPIFYRSHLKDRMYGDDE
jgi:hypothetical protein